MMKFHYREALTPVFLMKLLQSRLQRDVRIWVNTVFILISLKTEIARSVNGPKITRAPCRRRNGEAVPRAANFGDFITADHKVLSDSCESRNNHRYGVVVQDLATHWIQAYPCKNKTSLETQRSLQKFLVPDPVSTETQKHRFGLYLMSKKCKFLQCAKQELINTNFKQLEPKKSNNENNNFFKDNYFSRIWNDVKLIKEVSPKWKS